MSVKSIVLAFSGMIPLVLGCIGLVVRVVCSDLYRWLMRQHYDRDKRYIYRRWERLIGIK